MHGGVFSYSYVCFCHGQWNFSWFLDADKYQEAVGKAWVALVDRTDSLGNLADIVLEPGSVLMQHIIYREIEFQVTCMDRLLCCGWQMSYWRVCSRKNPCNMLKCFMLQG
jgi:hypothetical protein